MFKNLFKKEVVVVKEDQSKIERKEALAKATMYLDFAYRESAINVHDLAVAHLRSVVETMCSYVPAEQYYAIMHELDCAYVSVTMDGITDNEASRLVRNLKYKVSNLVSQY